MEQLYEEGRAVYTIFKGGVLPILLTNCENINGTWYYGYDYEKYKDLVQSAKDVGFSADHLPDLKEDDLFIQEDLFPDMISIGKVGEVYGDVMNLYDKITKE